MPPTNNRTQDALYINTHVTICTPNPFSAQRGMILFCLFLPSGNIIITKKVVHYYTLVIVTRFSNTFLHKIIKTNKSKVELELLQQFKKCLDFLLFCPLKTIRQGSGVMRSIIGFLRVSVQSVQNQ